MGAERTFEFAVPEGTSAGALLGDARRRASQVGIVIEGDETGGAFRGTAVGRYEVDGQTIRFAVERKPAFVTWNMIESGLEKMFAS